MMLLQKKIFCSACVLFFLCNKITAQLPELVVQKGNDDSINCIAYTPDGRNFLTVCSAESTVKIWEANSGRLLKTIAATAQNASYSDDGSRILIDETNQFTVYDAFTDSLLFFVNRGDKKFPSVSFANKGLWLVASGIDSVVEIKRAADNTAIRKINTKCGKVLSAQLSPDNKHLLAFSEDGTISIIDITNDSTLYQFYFPKFTQGKNSFSKTGKYILITESSSHGFLVEVSTGNKINNDGILLDISPDEKFLLTENGAGGSTVFYESQILNDSILFATPQFTNYAAVELRANYSKDGNFFSIWNPFFVSVYDSRNFERTASYRGDSVDYFVGARDGTPNPDNPPITSVSFNADGKKIFFGSATGKIKEMSTTESNNIYEIENPFNAIIDAQYIPMHPSIFTKAADNLGLLWNVEDATVQYAKDLTYFCDLGFDDSIGTTESKYRRKATFNNTGDFFITKSEVGSTVWRTKNFEKVLSTTGYENDVTKDLFGLSADGKFICRAEEDYNGGYEGINIFSIKIKSGLLTKTDSIAKDIFKIPNGFTLSANSIYFKGDSRHVIALFESQNKQYPFLIKTFQFRDSINVLVVSPYQYVIDSFGSTDDEALHYSFSTKLHCYIISANDTVYHINSSGKIIKKISIQLKQPQLTDELDFDPEAIYIFIKDGADNKIYAVNVETGMPIYFLKSSDTAFASISFSSDHKRFILLNNDRTNLSVFDAATGNLLFAFKGHTSQIFSAAFSSDGKFILCCAQDGSYEKRDAATGKLLYTFFLFKDNDYAIILPEGYYYASSTHDVHYLNFRLNNKLYNFSQFDLQFNRPDKILERLGSTDSALINAYHKAWLKRITESGFNEADFSNEQFHVPDVFLQNEDSLPATTSQKNLTIYFTFSDDTFKISSYNIYINDVPLNSVKGKKLSTSSNKIELSQTVFLSKGINKIEIGCTNEKGAESKRETVYITYQPSKKEVSKTWFIGIGINHYSQNGFLPNLSYCVKDIRDLATAFATKYDEIFVDTLLNANATRQNIIDVKKMLLQTNVEDRVIVSLSGHGLTYNDEFYFATPATDPANPTAEGISYSDLENLLDSIPARKKLLLIDACHSGEADPDEIEGGIVTTGMTYAAPKATSNNNKNDKSSVEIIDVKSDSINDSRKAFNIFGIMKNAFVDLRKNNGAFVIAASQSDQQAQENRELANGVFTRCMLDEIKNGSALNVSGLLKKINDCVSKNATGQDPANRQEPAESDWLLW